MKRFVVVTMFAVLLTAIFWIESSHGGPTRVGNGDDGTDLESTVPVKSGILIETRDEAAALLRRLNVSGIPGLGLLLPELEKAELLLVQSAKAPSGTNDHGESIYARTFAEPHAPTRFFPAALMLDRKQLVALHVHEALHRALPANIREDEKVVTRITLAITASESTHDRIRAAVTRDTEKYAAPTATDVAVAVEEPTTTERKSLLEYSYRSYFLPEAQKKLAPVSSLHSLKSFFYPLEHSSAFGFGAEFTFVVLPERSYLGPVGLTAQLNLGTWRSSDVDVFATLHLNTLSDGEIKNTPVGRDTATVGFSIRRDETKFRLENQFYFTTASDATQKIGGVEYTHKYGAMFGARIAAFGKSIVSPTSQWEWGGAGEVLLGNSHEVVGGPTPEKTGRLRVVSVGPEFGYITGDFRFSLNGRFIIDSTQGVSLDQIGDLMGHGVGQGSWGGAVSWRF